MRRADDKNKQKPAYEKEAEATRTRSAELRARRARGERVEPRPPTPPEPAKPTAKTIRRPAGAELENGHRYDPKTKYEFNLMSTADQALMHLQIADKMKELGMAGVPNRIAMFANSEMGATELKKNHQRVREFLAGVNAEDEKSLSVARAGKETASRSAETERTEKDSEEDMNRKSKSNVSKSKSKSNARTRVATNGLDPSKRITVLPAGKENPRREGTGPHKRYALILACAGKTVEHFVEKKGRIATLNRAIKEKRVRVA